MYVSMMSMFSFRFFLSPFFAPWGRRKDDTRWLAESPLADFLHFSDKSDPFFVVPWFLADKNPGGGFNYLFHPYLYLGTISNLTLTNIFQMG